MWDGVWKQKPSMYMLIYIHTNVCLILFNKVNKIIIIALDTVLQSLKTHFKNMKDNEIFWYKVQKLVYKNGFQDYS